MSSYPGLFHYLHFVAWYRISIKKKNVRDPLVGVRQFEAHLTYQQVERQAWQKATDKLGHQVIDNITLEKMPPDHPEVLEAIAKAKK